MVQMILQKTHWIILALILVCGLILSIAAIEFHLTPWNLNTDPNYKQGISGMQGGFDTLILDTELPKSPASVPIYKITSIDFISEGNELKAFTIKNSVPSSDEAPAFAEKGLEKYGGLPEDAQLSGVFPNYIYKHNLTTNTDEEKKPVGIQVGYRQILNGSRVMGSKIMIDLGENGEIIEIIKIWGVYEYAGEIKVISAERAFEKLRNYETTERLQGTLPEGSKVDNVQLGYWFDWKGSQKKDTLNGTYLKPVWVFDISLSSGGSTSCMVDATNNS
jgi:hypothetical protein